MDSYLVCFCRLCNFSLNWSFCLSIFLNEYFHSFAENFCIFKTVYSFALREINCLDKNRYCLLWIKFSWNLCCWLCLVFHVWFLIFDYTIYLLFCFNS